VAKLIIIILLLLINCNNSIVSNEKEIDSMSTIIELLAYRANQSSFFIVDNTEPFVDLQYDFDPIVEDVKTKSYFKSGDNFQLLSFMIRLPLCFRFYDEPATNQSQYLTLQHQNDQGDPPVDFAKLFVPFENYEMNQGNFYNFPTNHITKFRLWAKMSGNTKIDMYNVPDDMNGRVFHLGVYLKIRHNLPLE